jgi:hypothetical protein
MTRTREETLRERRKLREEYRDLFNATTALLFRHDPVGINFETNADEYEAEAGTILPRLRACRSEDDVLTAVYEEFLRWFDDSAGPRDRYEQIAVELWALWQTAQRDRADKL